MAAIYTVTVTGRRDKTFKCEECNAECHFIVERTNSGSATSLGLFSLFDPRIWKGASYGDIARDRAVARVTRDLEAALETFRCPACDALNNAFIASKRVNWEKYSSRFRKAMYSTLFSGSFAALSLLLAIIVPELPTVMWSAFSVCAAIFVPSVVVVGMTLRQVSRETPDLSAIDDSMSGVVNAKAGAATARPDNVRVLPALY